MRGADGKGKVYKSGMQGFYMGVEEGKTFWIVKGERIDGREIRRSDYIRHDIPIGEVFSMAEALMRHNGIVKGKVYVFKKVAETEIDLGAKKNKEKSLASSP